MVSFENNAHRESYKNYFLPTMEIKDYNVIIDWRNIFDQPIRNNITTYESIKKMDKEMITQPLVV